MNKTIIQDIGSFKAISEDGEEVIIIERQKFIIDDSFGETPKEMPSHKIYTTITGKTVNKKNDKQYELFDTGQILTRV